MISRQETKKLISETFIVSSWTSLSKHQILSFWTTFCCQNNTMPDTYSYDTFLSEIYDDMQSLMTSKEKYQTKYPELASFDAFDKFMCQYLV